MLLLKYMLMMMPSAVHMLLCVMLMLLLLMSILKFISASIVGCVSVLASVSVLDYVLFVLFAVDVCLLRGVACGFVVMRFDMLCVAMWYAALVGVAMLCAAVCCLGLCLV